MKAISEIFTVVCFLHITLWTGNVMTFIEALLDVHYLFYCLLPLMWLLCAVLNRKKSHGFGPMTVNKTMCTYTEDYRASS